MTRSDVFRGVQDIYDEDNLDIRDSNNSDVIEDWDSLDRINLVSAVEREFQIKFALDELATFQNYGSLIDLIIEKLK